MATPEIINLVDTDDEEFYKDLETQRTILNWDDSSDDFKVKVEDLDREYDTPEIINLINTDDEEFYNDPGTQQAILNWEDSSDDIKVKAEDLNQEYNTSSPSRHGRERNESGSSSRGQGSSLSFIHVGTSAKSQVPARPRRMIMEEESDSDAESLDNPWTPPAYTGHKLDIDAPVLGAPPDANHNRALNAGAS
ncbi:hypothetical protein BGX26_005497, partial [Mortierella sp. AD094]